MPQRLGALWSLLEASPEFKRLLAAAGRAHLSARMQVASEATAFALSALWRQAGLPVLVVAPRPEDARRLYDQIVVWAGDDAVLHFPETETLPFERAVSDSDTTVQRLRTLAAILDPGECPPLVVASTTAIAQKTIARDAFEGSRHVVRRGDRLVLERTLETWRRLGYRFEPVVDAPGLVSRRGGVVDIYPVRASAPTRIELWGDEVDSLRLFDPATQRSTEMTEAVEVTAAREALPGLMDRDELAEHVGAVDYSGCTDETRERIARELDDLTEGREVEEVGFYRRAFQQGLPARLSPRRRVARDVSPRGRHRGRPGARRALWGAQARQGVKGRGPGRDPVVAPVMAGGGGRYGCLCPDTGRYSLGRPGAERGRCLHDALRVGA